ncbi:lactadherin isoform X2 [Lingula anatina]|uniref:Lactadherin isoform X2 n=2 Tax=Lingula anatina TaxID=7574 RepID=A0A1S3HJ80_LINAN|nr:lactadherin isoform X2 [Lingula anatina]|eukprot:XP_013385516.1 lactadherin isoform X2 [Lingula anatina]
MQPRGRDYVSAGKMLWGLARQMTRQMAKLYLVGVLLLGGIMSLEGCDHHGPLGMITGSIQDWQITASSSYPQEWDKGCHEKYARLYQPNGRGWCAKYKSTSEWLQVDLGTVAKITGVMTQGRADGVEWVTKFMVSYSMDAFNWKYVGDQYGNQRVFDGNNDGYSVKHSYLDQPLMARFVKFHTVQWHKHPSMRVEILGCQECKEFIGLPPYGKITASDTWNFKKGKSCQPEDGHIFSNNAWCPKQNDAEQWLQFDVGPPTTVTGVVLKGRGDTRRKHWVTQFKISYSNDSKTWTFYKDASNLDFKPSNNLTSSRSSISTPYVSTSSNSVLPSNRPTSEAMEFGGNSDKDLERYHYFNHPFSARFIRIHPVAWHSHIAMRVGLIGCPHKGQCGEAFIRVNNDTPCVENLAYKKDTWINNKRHYKRHIRNHWTHGGHAKKVVDGHLESSIHSCTILDNFYVESPIMMVDLGAKTKISGAILITWQGEDPDKGAFKDYMYNLDKLLVYVDNNPKLDDIQKTGQMCGFISKVNNALYQEKLHVSCSSPMTGRYVYIEAQGVPNRWSRLFSAILCEVMVYG